MSARRGWYIFQLGSGLPIAATIKLYSQKLSDADSQMELRLIVQDRILAIRRPELTKPMLFSLVQHRPLGPASEKYTERIKH